MGKDGSVKVSVRVENSGEFDGDEVVQLYVRHLNSPVPVTPAGWWLFGQNGDDELEELSRPAPIAESAPRCAPLKSPTCST